MPRSLSKFMKDQGWTPVKRAPEGAACATCELPLDPEVTNYRRTGAQDTFHTAAYYCCHECALELYDDEGPEDDDGP